MGLNTMVKDNELIIGLILEKTTINKYIIDLIQWAREEEGINIAYYLIQSNDFISKDVKDARIKRIIKDGVIKTIQNRIKRWILKIEKKRNLENSTKHNDHSVTKNIDEYGIKRINYEAIYSKTGVSVRFSEESIEEIKNLDIDVFLRFNKRIIRGEILNLAKYGILSMHHGSDLTNRGGPSGFWEVYDEEPNSGFIIQQLTKNLDNGNIIFRGFIPTQKSWSLNRAELNLRALGYLKMIILNLLKNEKLPDFIDSFPFTGRLNTNPSLKEMGIYLTKRLRHRIKDKEYNNAENRYKVGFQKVDWGKLEYRKAKFIKNPDNYFLADPFVYFFKGENYCFVEAFNYLERKAHISVYKLTENTYEYLGIVLEEDFHLSFPYLFEFEGEIYMIPESTSNKDIRLYKSYKFPFDWRLEEVLIDNIDAADSMMLHHNERWWLFTNVDPLMKGNHNFQLEIFHSTSLNNGDWIPHRENPIFLNPTFARNGGFLFNGSNIYRVAQKFDFYMKYGRGLSIRKIQHLDEYSYIETEEVAYTDYYSDNILGSHHMHSNSIYTVFDIWSTNK